MCGKRSRKAPPDAVADLRVHAAEQLLRRLLGVSVRALEVRVITAPHDVLLAHRSHCVDGLVVLERRVHLPEGVVLRQ